SVLERGARQGTIRLTGEARAEAEIFMAAVHGAMLSARASGEWTVFSAVTAESLRLLQARA
ncbi:MAG: TetR/AcrR family transcriptional regulator, partial [Cystobacter sp.]